MTTFNGEQELQVKYMKIASEKKVKWRKMSDKMLLIQRQVYTKFHSYYSHVPRLWCDQSALFFVSVSQKFIMYYINSPVDFFWRAPARNALLDWDAVYKDIQKTLFL